MSDFLRPTGMPKWVVRATLTTATVLTGCTPPEPPPAPPAYVEARQPCADRSPLRRAYFGDLHVHTRNSFDAWAFEVRVTPEQAYAFAQGQEVRLPPLDGNGEGTQRLRLSRPLDFAAVTDHSEFLGEVQACTVPGSMGYESAACQSYRAGGNNAIAGLGIKLSLGDSKRIADICGNSDSGAASGCAPLLGEVWRRVQQAADGAYDRSSRCSFTSFVGYEYTGATGLSTLHRNVIFKNDHVPAPTTYFEQPTPEGLWQELRATCQQAGTGCDVLAIPHNSNESNGKMFLVEYPEGSTPAEQRAQAELRSALEPVAEIYQHKGDSECMNGLAGVGAPDELCGFEKTLREPAQIKDCGEGTGSGGTARMGCFARRDFLRNALLDGLKEEQRLGVNPFRLGFIASSDTHNGTPGAVSETRFIGHRGTDDNTVQAQLGRGNLTPGGVEFSPGGLAGVWAEENSRPALFAALLRREVFGTSGPRMTVRFFAGWDYAQTLCDDPQLLEKGYAQGVPMGGLLPTLPSGQGAVAPSFIVAAQRDPGDETEPANKLQLLQVVKGFLKDGQLQTQVFEVAGQRTAAQPDPLTCAPVSGGADSLCKVWRDPSFDPQQRAFYYVRVLENPSCRWNAHKCRALPPAERPASCSDPSVPKVVTERAWSSPIWYQPSATVPTK